MQSDINIKQSLNTLIKEADSILTSSVKNKHGEFIENEIGLYYWNKKCKELLTHSLSNHLLLEKTLSDDIVTPDELINVRNLLKSISEEY